MTTIKLRAPNGGEETLVQIIKENVGFLGNALSSTTYVAEINLGEGGVDLYVTSPPTANTKGVKSFMAHAAQYDYIVRDGGKVFVLPAGRAADYILGRIGLPEEAIKKHIIRTEGHYQEGL